MEPNAKLTAALARAYEVFAAYRRPTYLDASPAYGDQDFLKPLIAAPLRQLTSDQLGIFAGKAMTTVGDVPDYKHFLPRILEEAVIGNGAHIGTDPFFLARKIVYGGWTDWPLDERTAVLDVYRTAWAQALSEPREITDVEDWLVAQLTLDEPLSPLLAQWEAAPGLNSALHLAAAVYSEAQNGPKGRRPFWDGLDASVTDQYCAWLRSLAVKARVAEAASLAGEDEWEVHAALDWLATPD